MADDRFCEPSHESLFPFVPYRTVVSPENLHWPICVIKAGLISSITYVACLVGQSHLQYHQPRHQGNVFIQNILDEHYHWLVAEQLDELYITLLKISLDTTHTCAKSSHNICGRPHAETMQVNNLQM